MSKTAISTLVIGSVFFVVSTAVLTGVAGCNHRSDWMLPWIIVSTSVARRGFTITGFSPLVLLAQLALCFGIARVVALCIPFKQRNTGPNMQVDGTA